MKTCLITGASSGIGKETAYVFAKNGYNLILAARRIENLNSIKIEILQKYNCEVDVINIDLSKQNSAEELYNKVLNLRNQPDVLINNAGFGVGGYFLETDLKKEEDMLILNMVTLTKLTKFFIKDMIKKNNGHIINIASTAAFQPIPLMACYAATKAYVKSFSEAIAFELKDTGIKVTSICPGATSSEFSKVANVEKSNLFKNVPSSEELANFIYNSMMRNKTTAIHGFKNKFLAASSKFMPKKLVASITMKMVK